MDGKEWNDFINLKNLYYPILPAGFWWMAKNEIDFINFKIFTILFCQQGFNGWQRMKWFYKS